MRDLAISSDSMSVASCEMQIEASQDWIGFRFSTLYDAIFETAGYPELSIGTVGPGGRTLPNDSKLVRELDDRVVGMLGEEFGYQQVRLQLDRIDTVEAGARYLRIDAQGIADDLSREAGRTKRQLAKEAKKLRKQAAKKVAKTRKSIEGALS